MASRPRDPHLSEDCEGRLYDWRTGRGEGVLLVGGKPAGYYRIAAASFGFQAGGQSFSYALFLMNDAALDLPSPKRRVGDRVGT